MKVMVTGAAGFIGSNLTDALLERGHVVIGYDNLSTGRAKFLADARQSSKFTLVQADLLDLEVLAAAMIGVDIVYHLAANADVRFGTEHPRRDTEQNLIGTQNVLEAMRLADVRRIAFSSTGSVYGEAAVFPTPENAPFPVQTSLYGASKLAAEGLISAYCEAFGLQATVFRFVSILGPRYTHGHVFDFCRMLLANPHQLRILGNGEQRKSYLHVADCISAIFAATDAQTESFSIFNLGTDHYCKVNESVGWICKRLNLSPERVYSGGERGWIGDSPFIFLDCSKIRKLGWAPRFSIREGVEDTVDFLLANAHLLDRAP